jgi:hypothetical protein
MDISAPLNAAISGNANGNFNVIVKAPAPPVSHLDTHHAGVESRSCS